MKEAIGTSAGTVWRLLQENDKVALSQVPKMLKENEALTYQALGWLAREGKVEYHAEGRTTYVSSSK